MSRLANLLISLSFRHQQPLENEKRSSHSTGGSTLLLCLSRQKQITLTVEKEDSKKWGVKKFFASPTAERRWRKNENVYQQYGQEQCWGEAKSAE